MKLLTVREAVALGLACSVSAWFLLDYCIASNQRLPSEQIGIILVTVLAGVVSTTILYKEQTAPGQTSSLRVIRQRLETSRLDFLNQLNDKRQRFLEQSLKQEQKQNQTLIEEPLADAVYTFYPATERAPLSAAFRDYSADHVMLTQLKQTLSQLIQANQDHLADECRTELAVWRQWLMETDSHLCKRFHLCFAEVCANRKNVQKRQGDHPCVCVMSMT